MKTPAVVMRPILLPAPSVNHSAPSGPATMLSGKLFAVGIVNSVITPATVICPILLVPVSVNHRAPSGPAATLSGELFAVGMVYSVMLCAAASVGSVPKANTIAARSISDRAIFTMNVAPSANKYQEILQPFDLAYMLPPKRHPSVRQTRLFAFSAGSKSLSRSILHGNRSTWPIAVKGVCREMSAPGES